MFGIGLPEIGVILVVAVVVFGPDRLPDYARQAGRVLRQVRTFVNNAQQDLRDELGPEFADLKLTDLDPRTALRKHVLEALDEPAAARTGTMAAATAAGAAVTEALGPGERPPFDPEAT